VAVREWEDQVIFLHRIVEGGTDRSYGIHVARLAGLPKNVLERANQLLGELAVHHVAQVVHSTNRAARSRRGASESQLQLFVEPSKQVAIELAAVDVEKLTPERAIELVQRWREMFK
jgi:DNA mismatch repair protein MutS